MTGSSSSSSIVSAVAYNSMDSSYLESVQPLSLLLLSVSWHPSNHLHSQQQQQAPP